MDRRRFLKLSGVAAAVLAMPAAAKAAMKAKGVDSGSYPLLQLTPKGGHLDYMGNKIYFGLFTSQGGWEWQKQSEATLASPARSGRG